MSYTPTNWQTGDIVTAEKLNKLENGVASGGGGGTFVVTRDEETGALDKTWKEIRDAIASGQVPVIFPSALGSDTGTRAQLDIVGRAKVEEDLYMVVSIDNDVWAINSENGYPVFNYGKM